MNPDYPAAVFAAVLALAAVAFLAVRGAKVKHGWPWRPTAGRHRAVRVGTYRGAWQAQQPVGAR